MRTIRQLIFSLLTYALVFSSLAGCLPKEQGGGVNWPKVSECSGGIVDDLIPIVTSILFNDRKFAAANDRKSISAEAKSKLEQLALNRGPEAVECAVGSVLNDWTKPGASQSPDRLEAIARGRDFLNQIGATPSFDAEPDAFNWHYHLRLDPPLASEGFRPLELATTDHRPWHIMLSSARGTRS